MISRWRSVLRARCSVFKSVFQHPAKAQTTDPHRRIVVGRVAVLFRLFVSPEYMTVAELVTDGNAAAATATRNVTERTPDAGSGSASSHVTIWPFAAQPSPATKLRPVGNVSVIRMSPLVAATPRLLTVRT